MENSGCYSICHDNDQKTKKSTKPPTSCERVYSNESVDTKIFIGFVATIIRSRIYTLLKDELTKLDKKPNYMTVPTAIRELEKIEMLKGADNDIYSARLDQLSRPIRSPETLKLIS